VAKAIRGFLIKWTVLNLCMIPMMVSR